MIVNRQWSYTAGAAAIAFLSMLTVAPLARAQDCRSSVESDRQGESCVSPTSDAVNAELTHILGGLSRKINGLRRQKLCSAEGGFGACGSVQGGAASADHEEDMLLSSGRLSLLALHDYSAQERDRTSLGEGFEQSANALTVGVDYRFSDALFAGATLSASQSDTELDNNAGDQESDSLIFATHLSRYFSQFFIDALLGYGSGDLDIKRDDGISGYSASTDSDYWSGDVALGYGYSNQRWRITPMIRAQFLRGSIDGYRERSEEASGILKDFDEQDVESTRLELSLQADYVVLTSWGVLIPTSKLELVQEFADATSVKGRAFNAFDNSLNSTFDETSDDPDDTTGVVGVGVSAQFQRGWSAYANGDLLIGHSYLDKFSLVAGLRYEWP